MHTANEKFIIIFSYRMP